MNTPCGPSARVKREGRAGAQAAHLAAKKASSTMATKHMSTR